MPIMAGGGCCCCGFAPSFFGDALFFGDGAGDGALAGCFPARAKADGRPLAAGSGGGVGGGVSSSGSDAGGVSSRGGGGGGGCLPFARPAGFPRPTAAGGGALLCAAGIGREPFFAPDAAGATATPPLFSPSFPTSVVRSLNRSLNAITSLCVPLRLAAVVDKNHTARVTGRKNVQSRHKADLLFLSVV
jgi:hypothetical protein